jgi:hypothetical protein
MSYNIMLCEYRCSFVRYEYVSVDLLYTHIHFCFYPYLFVSLVSVIIYVTILLHHHPINMNKVEYNVDF